jgi:hypothetical protein
VGLCCIVANLYILSLKNKYHSKLMDENLEASLPLAVDEPVPI